MSDKPRSVAFHGPDAPERERWLVFLYAPRRPTKKEIEEGILSAEGRLPIVFTSASKAGALARADAWWAEQKAAEANRRKVAVERAEQNRRRAA